MSPKHHNSSQRHDEEQSAIFSKSNKIQGQQNQLYSSDSDNEQETNNKTQTKQQIKPSIEFGENAIQMKCPFCLQSIWTEILFKPEFISIIFGFSIFLVFPHLITLVITIIALQLTATRKHRCPLCERQLGTDGKFLVFFKDQMYSFAFGTNGLIISKKIIASIGIGLFIVAILSIKIIKANADLTWTSLTWQQFIRQCPIEELSAKCKDSNNGFTVKNWQGYLMRVQDNRNSLKKHFEHAVSIYVKMNDQKSLNINRQTPDLLLTINSYQSHVWHEILDNLSHGDQIIFNATFTHMNNRGLPYGRHLNLVDLNITGHKDPSVHIYMTEVQDIWFFNNLSGQKLRKHSQEVQVLIQKPTENQDKQKNSE